MHGQRVHRVSAKTSVVDYQILSRDEAIRFQRIKELNILWRVPRAKMQVAEAIDSARLLPARSERPCRRRNGNYLQEITSLHCEDHARIGFPNEIKSVICGQRNRQR